jgi:proteic killer suppression protein
MEIYFKSKKDEKIFNSAEKMNNKWGSKIANKIRQRLAELYAAEHLSQINWLPPTRLHLLTENRKNLYAVDLYGPWRLVFRPANDPLPIKKDGGIDKSRVTEITILEVVNYHGK